VQELNKTTGVGGGIIEMEEPSAQQVLGAGITMYYFVDSIEEVIPLWQTQSSEFC
jgi:hypothetical protein